MVKKASAVLTAQMQVSDTLYSLLDVAVQVIERPDISVRLVVKDVSVVFCARPITPQAKFAGGFQTEPCQINTLSVSVS